MKNEKLSVRLALVWLTGICGWTTYLLGHYLFLTLAGSPEGEPHPTFQYYLIFGLMLVVMAAIATGSFFLLIFPDVLETLLECSGQHGCDHCGYDLTQTKKDRQIYCPECGEEINYEEDGET